MTDRSDEDERPASLLALMVRPGVIATAIKVAMVVGTCLNAINQGPAIWHGEAVAWGKFALNYCVPYLVASYSAARSLQGRAA